MQPVRVPPGATVDASGAITFRVDPDEHWQPSRVWFYLRDFGADPTFRLESGQWVARIPRPPVDRLEYLLDIVSPTGERQLVCDPANPMRAPGVFGDKSVVTLPWYRAPQWLTTDALRAPELADPDHSADPDRAAGVYPVQDVVPWKVVDLGGDDDLGPGRDLRRARWARLRPPEELLGPTAQGEQAAMDPGSALAAVGTLLAPADSKPADPLPLLLVHDGPEYAELAALTRYLQVLAARDPALRCRVLLLRPVDRDRSYSASPGYARALVDGLLPQVRATVAVHGPLVGMGASLGGLSMVHIALTRPDTLGAVFSQSGSFFARDTDPMELGYRFFDRIAEFVAGVDVDRSRLHGLRIALTCGTGEDNLDNNRQLHRRLAAAGVPTTIVENPDGHTYTGWRDCLDPTLGELLRAVWRVGPSVGAAS